MRVGVALMERLPDHFPVRVDVGGGDIGESGPPHAVARTANPSNKVARRPSVYRKTAVSIPPPHAAVRARRLLVASEIADYRRSDCSQNTSNARVRDGILDTRSLCASVSRRNPRSSTWPNSTGERSSSGRPSTSQRVWQHCSSSGATQSHDGTLGSGRWGEDHPSQETVSRHQTHPPTLQISGQGLLALGSCESPGPESKAKAQRVQSLILESSRYLVRHGVEHEVDADGVTAR